MRDADDRIKEIRDMNNCNVSCRTCDMFSPCDDCGDKICRMFDNEYRHDFKEGLVFCGECIGIRKHDKEKQKLEKKGD